MNDHRKHRATRPKPDWELQLRIPVQEIDVVRKLYAAVYGVPWRNVTRTDVERWAQLLWEQSLQEQPLFELLP